MATTSACSPPSIPPTGSAASCTGRRPSHARRLTTSSRSAARSGSPPTARSPTSLPSRPEAWSRPAARSARATSTWSTSTSRWCRWSAGTRRSAPARRWSAPSTPTRPRRSPTTSPPRSALAASSTGSRPGSPSPRRLPGPVAAGTAATTRSFPTGSTSTPLRPGRSRPASELRVLFVGRPEERKGLPILLTAFGALVEHVPCRLTVIGAEREDVLHYLADPELMRWIDVQGRVSGERLWRSLHEADVLCAPSLSGESFGMVLTEAFAAGTPVIASAIAGYSDVVTDGVDGILVPPADPAAPRRGAAARPPRARAPAGDGRGGAAERPALRLAARRRPRDRGLRAGDRDARARRRRPARRALGRHPARRRRPAPPRSATALARPGACAARQPRAAGWRAAPGWASPGRSGSG